MPRARIVLILCCAGCVDAIHIPTTEDCLEDGQLFCDGACIDVVTSREHCGACGNACSCGTACFAGACTTPSSLPTPRTGHVAVGVNGLIYVIGGHESGTVTGDVTTFDPRTNRWTRRKPMNVPRTFMTAVVEGDNIWAIGGSTTGPEAVTLSAVVEVYSVSNDEWAYKAALTLARQDGAAAIGSDGKIRVFWGAANSGYTNTVEKFEDDAWHSEPTPYPGRVQHRAVVDESGVIYLLGGFGPSSFGDKGLTVVTVFDASRGDPWDDDAPDMQSFHALGGAVTGADGQLYVAGGTDNGSGDARRPVDAFEKFQPGSTMWTQLAAMPDVRFDTAAAATPQGIYVIGGAPTNSLASSDAVFFHDPICNEWTR